MTQGEIHYQTLLADYYSWLYGGFEVQAEENRSFFEKHGISPQQSSNAVDLGAGPGFQSIPLAASGFEVDAVDTCQKLLDELGVRKGALNITCHCRDALNFLQSLSRPVELAVCMGDTLSHFDSRDYISRLISTVYGVLEGEGKIVLTFRDLSVRLDGIDRFIPVRSDENKIFTCFLEYLDDKVRVHDLIYTRRKGKWILKKGVYHKIRLDMPWVAAELKRNRFRVENVYVTKGLVNIIAVK